MQEYSTSYVTLDEWTDAEIVPGEVALATTLSDGTIAYANVATRASAERLVVFVPGAQNSKSPRRSPFFHRWTWHERLPDAHVIALSDPSIAFHDTMLGGWFMNPDIDFVAELAEFVGKVADHLGVRHDRVAFHGSSLGGFGAIGMAAHLPGASALAENPQIDVEQWPFPEAIRILGELVGAPLSEFRRSHPEQVDLLARLRFARRVPPFLLVTNTRDQSHALHLGFLEDVKEIEADHQVLGQQRMLITDIVVGHKPLPADVALELVRELLDD